MLNLSIIISPPPHRFESNASEVDSSDRLIVFTVFDGIFSASDSITLSIETINDNPTTVSGGSCNVVSNCCYCCSFRLFYTYKPN